MSTDGNSLVVSLLSQWAGNFQYRRVRDEVSNIALVGVGANGNENYIIRPMDTPKCEDLSLWYETGVPAGFTAQFRIEALNNWGGNKWPMYVERQDYSPDASTLVTDFYCSVEAGQPWDTLVRFTRSLQH